MAKIVVSGAAGFVGSHTVEALLERGDEVIGIDNFDPYYDVRRKHANLEEIRAQRAAELLAHSYHHLYGLNVTVLRFFTVYGPRNRPDMMAFKVVDGILRGREIPLYQGGQMYRDWTYVGDTVAGIVAAVDRPMGY